MDRKLVVEGILERCMGRMQAAHEQHHEFADVVMLDRAWLAEILEDSLAPLIGAEQLLGAWRPLLERLALVTPHSARAYGAAENHVHLTEEIGELVKELGVLLVGLNKHRRGYAGAEAIAEELCDVVIIGTCIVAELAGLDVLAEAFHRKLSKGEGRLRERGYPVGDPNDRTWVPEDEWKAREEPAFAEVPK